jgi:hypothetical protein
LGSFCKNAVFGAQTLFDSSIPFQSVKSELVNAMTGDGRVGPRPSRSALQAPPAAHPPEQCVQSWLQEYTSAHNV